MTAEELHRRSIVVDGHCDTLILVTDDEYDLAERHENHHIDLPRAKEGGLTAQVFAVYVGRPHIPGQATHRALTMIDALYRTIDANPQDLCLVIRADDITDAKQQGQLGAILGLEGAESLEGDLSVLRMLHRLGLRNVGLTWNYRNQAADGLGESRTNGGLTTFGVALVEEMNRLGMTIDVAHLAPAGVDDVLTLSRAPIIASHANARAICDHPRNLTDQQLERIAANGGVVGVTFVPDFVAVDREQATLSRLLDHIEHLIKVMGDDHVGLGSDFDGYHDPGIPGLEDVSKIPAITAGLLERGYGETTIQKVLGENYLRVFRGVIG